VQTRGTVRKSLLAFAEGAGLAPTQFHHAHLVELADDLHWLGVVGSEIKFRAAARLAKLVGPNQVVLSMRREGRGGRVSDCHAPNKATPPDVTMCAANSLDFHKLGTVDNKTCDKEQGRPASRVSERMQGAPTSGASVSGAPHL